MGWEVAARKTWGLWNVWESGVRCPLPATVE